MKLVEFFDHVEADSDLCGLGVDESNEVGLIVEHTPTGIKTKICTDEIDKNDWDSLRDIMVCNRDPMALQHISRVVGYFSRVNNWNKSKIGERASRSKGNYVVS